MYFESYKLIWFFWLIPLLGVLYLLFERRRKRLLNTILSTKLAENKLGYSPGSYLLRFVLFALALIFLGVALLKPYSDYEIHTIKKKGIDLYVLLDLSTSMNAQDIKPNRISRAKREIIDFLDMLQGDRVGLIGYAGDSFTFVPLTHDYGTYELFLSEINPGDIPVPGTDIKGAIEKAVKTFQTQSRSKSKAIILISDGEDSVGLSDSVIEAIKEYNIKIYVIGLGTDAGSPIPLPNGGYHSDAKGKVVISKLNEGALKQLAVETGGAYVRSVSGDLDWEQIYFEGIKKSFEDDELQSREKKIPNYIFQIFLLLGLIFLILEILITNRKLFWLGLIFRRKNLVIIFVLLLPFESQAFNILDSHKGDRAYEDQSYEEALTNYQNVLTKSPQDTQTAFNLANTYYKLDKFEEALNSYKQALNSEDKSLRQSALYNMGNSLYRLNKLKESIEYYEKSLEMNPEDKRAQLNYEFVKKKLEQKEQEEKEKEEKEKEQEKQEEEQKQEEKQEQENSEEQEKDENKEQDQENKEEQEQNDKEESQENEQEKDQEEQQEEKQEEYEEEEKQSGKEEKEQDFEFDYKPEQWLNSVKDEPKEALKYLIQKQSNENEKKDSLEKDW